MVGNDERAPWGPDYWTADPTGLYVLALVLGTAPYPVLNENGVECPFPFDPPQLVGAPLGQYHCPYCGAMVLAGCIHPNYEGLDEDYERYMASQEAYGTAREATDGGS